MSISQNLEAGEQTNLTMLSGGIDVTYLRFVSRGVGHFGDFGGGVVAMKRLQNLRVR